MSILEFCCENTCEESLSCLLSLVSNTHHKQHLPVEPSDNIANIILIALRDGTLFTRCVRIFIQLVTELEEYFTSVAQDTKIPQTARSLESELSDESIQAEVQKFAKNIHLAAQIIITIITPAPHLTETACSIELLDPVVKVLKLLRTFDFSFPLLLSSTVDLLTAFLSSCADLDVESVVCSLCVVFERQLAIGGTSRDKECRNKIINALVILLQANDTSAQFLVAMDKYKLIIDCSYAAERPKCDKIPNNIRQNIVTILDIDIKFKEILWTLIQQLLALPVSMSAREYIEHNTELLPVLLEYIEFKHALSDCTQSLNNTNFSFEGTVPQNNLNSSYTNQSQSLSQNQSRLLNNHKYEMTYMDKISTDHIKSLQLCAANFLVNHAATLGNQFIAIDGIERVVNMLSQSLDSNEKHTDNIAYECLLILQSCSEGNYSSDMRLEILETDSLSILSKILSKTECQLTKAAVLSVIGSVCRDSMGHSHIREKEHIISQLVDILEEQVTEGQVTVGTFKIKKKSLSKRTIELFENSFLEGDASILLVSTVDCLRLLLKCNIESQMHFVRVRGLNVLLGLLEVTSYCMRPMLLDLLRVLLCHSAFGKVLLAWRSSHTLQSALSMLSKIWFDEETRVSKTHTQDNNRVARNYISDADGSREMKMAYISDDDDDDDDDEKPTETWPSFVSSKLTEVINNRNASEYELLPKDTRKSMLDNWDIRASVSQIFLLIGVYRTKTYDNSDQQHGDDKIEIMTISSNIDMFSPAWAVYALGSSYYESDWSIEERLAIATARRYPLFCQGKWWRDLVIELNDTSPQQQLSQEAVEQASKLLDQELMDIYDWGNKLEEQKNDSLMKSLIPLDENLKSKWPVKAHITTQIQDVIPAQKVSINLYDLVSSDSDSDC